MRTKIFVVSLFLLLATVLFTGCGTESKSIGEDLEAAQRIAKDFLTIPGYQIPEGYEIRYLYKDRSEFVVAKKNSLITFNLEGKVTVIENDGKRITAGQIQEIQQVAQDFLNTTAYVPESNYAVQYKGKNKKMLEVTEKKSHLTITFDISKEEMEIDDISYVIVKEKSSSVKENKEKSSSVKENKEKSSSVKENEEKITVKDIVHGVIAFVMLIGAFVYGVYGKIKFIVKKFRE